MFVGQGTADSVTKEYLKLLTIMLAQTGWEIAKNTYVGLHAVSNSSVQSNITAMAAGGKKKADGFIVDEQTYNTSNTRHLPGKIKTNSK